MFLKIKLESSGVPADTNLYDFISQAQEKQSVTLERDKIEFNPGRRAVSKLCLNSLWGKFGQRQNMDATEYVTDVARFYNILLDSRKVVNNFNVLTDEMVEINYHYRDQFVEDDFNTNVYIAAFTTAHARLSLYGMLDYLGEKVLYYDTDSVYYIDSISNPVSVPLGSLLGEWTLECEGTEWVNTGPKSYSLKGKCCKVKGFSLNHENSKFINDDCMTAIVKGEVDERVIVEENKIARDEKSKWVVNKYMEKAFRFDYDKRVINRVSSDHVDTLPFGY